MTTPVRLQLFVRSGTILLFGSFVALLAGRFTFDRASASLPSFDLRLVMLYFLGLGFTLWYGASREYLSPRIKMAGLSLFVAWVSWLALSAAWAPAGARTLDTLLDLGLLCTFLLMGWALIGWLPREATSKLWTWTLVAGLIYFAGAMIEGPNGQGRYSAFGGGPNIFVRVMVLAAIAALSISASRKKVWPLAAIPLFAVGAVLSGSRGGLVSAAIILALFAVPVARTLGAKKTVRLLILGGIGAALASAWSGAVIIKFIQQRYIQQTVVERYTSGRSSITDQALNMYEQHPIVGVGLDGYYALQQGPSVFEYPHNLLLATAAESGTIGAVILVLVVFRFLLVVRKIRALPVTVLMATAAGSYLALASLFSGDYYDSRLMWLFFGFAVIEAVRPVAAPDKDAAVGRKSSPSAPATSP